MEEQIHGVSMRDCAEIMSKHSELQAQHGESSYRPHFAQFLSQRGIDEHTWANAWNAWWSRMESDPSGQLHAKYHMMMQQGIQQAHMADVRDMTQDAKEGVTLDTYAKIMAKIAGGEDANQLLAANGLELAQWQRAQTAWNTAMGQDTNHHITTQYGQLYAKYTPGFEQQMQGQIAATMAADHAQRAAGIPDDEEEEYTFEDMVREMGDATPNTRWTAAHHVANRWDIGDRSDSALRAAAEKAVALANECLEQHNDFTASNAETLAGDLKMFAAEGFLTPEQASDAEGNMARCLNRAKDQLQTLEAGFAPIKDKAVPERIKMQTSIQTYTSLVGELSEILEEWEDNYQAPSESSTAEDSIASSSAPASSSSSSSAAVRPANDGGLMAILRSLPIIGPIVRMLGL